MKLDINGTVRDLDAPPGMPLLWVIRDLAGLTGTKFGCGMAPCGAVPCISTGNPCVRACCRFGRRGAQIRRSRHLGRRFASRAARVDGGGRGAVRVLPIRADHDRRGAPGKT